MKTRSFLITLFLISFYQNAMALKERHLVVLQPSPIVQPITEKDRQLAEETASLLLAHGFDNRSISAVYVAPNAFAVETAELLSEIGLFSKDKIHREIRLKETHSQIEAQPTLMAFYHEVERQHNEGHVLVITPEKEAILLVESATKNKVKLQPSQPYLIPLESETAYS